MISSFLTRQSDQDFPVTRFANGIKWGKLMAQEYPGILLCMAAVLRSTGGRLVLKRKKEHFGNEEALRDWSQLVETLLQWERWLKSTSMEKQHVKQAKEKHRYIMYLMKKVAKWSTGMQLKLTKFHGIVHMAEDILNFGVPMEFDTGSNESGHKPTKTAARLTKKTKKLLTIKQQFAWKKFIFWTWQCLNFRVNQYLITGNINYSLSLKTHRRRIIYQLVVHL
jgi:hypothetical protein